MKKLHMELLYNFHSFRLVIEAVQTLNPLFLIKKQANLMRLTPICQKQEIPQICHTEKIVDTR